MIAAVRTRAGPRAIAASGRGSGRDRVASGLALIVSVAIFFGGLNSVVGNDLIAIGFAALFAFAVLRFGPPPRFWRRAAWVLVPAALAWGWAALGAVGGVGSRPVAPDLAPSALIGFVGYWLGLMTAAMVGAAGLPPKRTIDRLLAFGVPGLALALAFQGADEWPWTRWVDPLEGRFLGTLDNANAAAACYGVLATLALTRALAEGSAPWQPRATPRLKVRGFVYPFILLLALGGCLLTKSRSGAVLTFAAMAIVIVRGALASRRRGWKITPAMLGVGVLAAVVVLVVSGQAFDRVGRLPSELSVRLLLWHHNAEIAAARPLFGYGIGSFSAVNAPGLVSIGDAEAMWTVNSPHNIVLRLMIDAGLPYLALLCAAALAGTAQVARFLRSGTLGLDDLGLIAALAILVGMAMVDITLEVPGLLALAVTIAGLLWGRALAGAPGRIPPAHLDPASAERPGRR